MTGAATGTGPSPVRATGPLPVSASVEGGDGGAHRPSDRAYLGIRQAILTGELQAGDHLHEENLAAMTGTSRSPVRMALGRLVSEGLARVENRQRFVSEYSHDEIVIAFEIRARIESLAAGLAARNIGAAELDELEGLIARIDRLAEAGGDAAADTYVALNARFHEVIVQASGSHQIGAVAALASAMPLVMVKQFLLRQSIGIERSNEQHRDILAALRDGNADWAAAAMSSHILSTRPRGPAGATR